MALDVKFCFFSLWSHICLRNCYAEASNNLLCSHSKYLAIPNKVLCPYWLIKRRCGFLLVHSSLAHFICPSNIMKTLVILYAQPYARWKCGGGKLMCKNWLLIRCLILFSKAHVTHDPHLRFAFYFIRKNRKQHYRDKSMKWLRIKKLAFSKRH
jgi:hypothetical protein